MNKSGDKLRMDSKRIGTCLTVLVIFPIHSPTHCLGAIDGKHIRLTKPPHSGTVNYNYKHFFSTVLLGVCDSRYRLLYVDIGSPGSNSDGGVFSTSNLKRLMDSNQLGLPQPTQLPQSAESTPYYLVGDAAFPLRQDLMKPFPRQQLNHDEKVFNYR